MGSQSKGLAFCYVLSAWIDSIFVVPAKPEVKASWLYRTFFCVVSAFKVNRCYISIGAAAIGLFKVQYFYLKTGFNQAPLLFAFIGHGRADLFYSKSW